jgi:hypothetical protein
MEVFVIVVNTKVEELEEYVIPKPIQLVIPKIGVGAKVTLIDIVTHASKVFRITNIVLKETHVVARMLIHEHVSMNMST